MNARLLALATLTGAAVLVAVIVPSGGGAPDATAQHLDSFEPIRERLRTFETAYLPSWSSSIRGASPARHGTTSAL